MLRTRTYDRHSDPSIQELSEDAVQILSPPKVGGRCSVISCELPSHANGMCRAHDARVKKHGNALADVPIGTVSRFDKIEGECSIEVCTGRATNRAGDYGTVCTSHYSRWRQRDKSKRPMEEAIKRRKGWYRGADGYILLSGTGHPNANSTGVVAEHTVIMSNHIGRPLLPSENVHHKNGIRHDNRIENLELWTKRQPTGTRVSDLVAYANEIIETYGTNPTVYP